MMQSRPILTLSLNVPAVLAAGLMVTEAGVVPAAGARSLGCLREACTKAGSNLPVDVLGTTVATAGAAFANGALLMNDGSGNLIAWTSTNVAVARALEAATALGDRPEVLLIPN